MANPETTGGKTYDLGRFWETIGRMEALMAQLMSSEEREWGNRKGIPKDGVYVLYKNEDPIYVGRSNKLSTRIGQHGWPSSGRNSATLAFKLLKKKLLEEGHPVSGQKDAQIEAMCGEEFRAQKEHVQSMAFRVVPIIDDLEQYLFEAYAICKFGTSPERNDFRNT